MSSEHSSRRVKSIEDAVPDEEVGAHNDGGEDNRVPPRGRTGSTRVSQMQFFAYYLFERPGQFNSALHCDRLLQELIIDCWARTGSGRLRYIQTHQKELRADLYKGVADAIDNGLELGAIGRKVVLPSSFPGSPWQLHALTGRNGNRRRAHETESLRQHHMQSCIGGIPATS